MLSGLFLQYSKFREAVCIQSPEFPGEFKVQGQVPGEAFSIQSPGISTW